MAILSNIGADFIFYCFYSFNLMYYFIFSRKMEKATQYGRPTVILFMISIILMVTGSTNSEHPVIEFFYYFKFHFIYFLPCTSNLICN